MSLPAAVDRPAIVSRLRGAGCVFAEDEAEVLISAAATPATLSAMVERRAAGLPLQQVVGWTEFCGQRVDVDVGVFVPRQRTALLVRQAIAVTSPQSTIVDLCCGSGAVGAAVAAALAPDRLAAVDVDAAAVRCAERNLAPWAGRVFQGDLVEPLPPHWRGQVDLLVANVPYVPTPAVAFLPPEARLHEPTRAFDGGPDGLDVLRRVAAAAPRWLVVGGHLVVEVSAGQVRAACEVIARRGLAASVVHSADLDATVVTGRRG